MKTIAAKHPPESENKRLRKERNAHYERTTQLVFEDTTKSRLDQATTSLEMLGDKMCHDIQEQAEHVLRSRDDRDVAQQETARLLRMLESRRSALAKLERALATDTEILRQASLCLLVEGSDAQN